MPKYRRKFALRKRAFINPWPSDYNSYISVAVEDSKNGEYALGTNLIHISDCRRVVELHFDLCDPRDRKESLWKIDELLDILSTFRSALYKQSKLIDKHEGREQD